MPRKVITTEPPPPGPARQLADLAKGQKQGRRALWRDETPLDLHHVGLSERDRIYLSDEIRLDWLRFHFAYRRRYLPAYDPRLAQSYLNEIMIVSPQVVAQTGAAWRVAARRGLAGDELFAMPHKAAVALIQDGHSHPCWSGVSTTAQTGRRRAMTVLRNWRRYDLKADLARPLTPYGETGWDRLYARDVTEVVARWEDSLTDSSHDP